MKSENRMEDNASPSAQQMDTRCVYTMSAFSRRRLHNSSKIEVLRIEDLDVETPTGELSDQPTCSYEESGLVSV